MHYLKEGRKLFYVAVVLPVFFLYPDKTIALWIKGFDNELQIHRCLESIDPLINVVGNGATLIFSALLLWIAGELVPLTLVSIMWSDDHDFPG